jgi:hypothetical protein
MTVKCFVSLPDEVTPEIHRFVTLPRVGEEIDLPDHHEDFVVESISHFARKVGDDDRPTVQIHLRALPRKKIQQRRIGFLAP